MPDMPAFETAFSAALKQDEVGGYIPCWSRADLFSRK